MQCSWYHSEKTFHISRLFSKLGGGKKRFFRTKESLPHKTYPERVPQIQMPRLQKVIKPDVGLEGLNLRGGGGRKRGRVGSMEEMGLAINLDDFQ